MDLDGVVSRHHLMLGAIAQQGDLDAVPIARFDDGPLASLPLGWADVVAGYFVAADHALDLPKPKRGVSVANRLAKGEQGLVIAAWVFGRASW